MSTACEAFVSAHVAAHPEDASSLGMREHASRLSDPGKNAADHELAMLRACLRDLSAEAPEDEDARLDLACALGRAKFRVRALEADRGAETLEPSLLPNAAIVHTLLHARDAEDSRASFEAVLARARAVPAYLESCLENLRRGAKEGRAPDRDVTRAFVERLLPGASRTCAVLGPRALASGAPETLAASIDEASRDASLAYAAFAKSVAEEIAPRARACVRLGDRETRARLSEMGVGQTVDELLSFAEEQIAAAHRSIAEILGKTASDNVHNTREAIRALLSRTHVTVEDAVARYQSHVSAAIEFVRARDLVPIPADLALDFAPLPEGIADGASLTNWPAPLFDPRGKGHALFGTDPTSHAIVATKNLAVHEAIPGHYLQSVAWQRSFGSHSNRAHAARFFGVADDVAFADGWFGAMMSVEGWAVHMEHRMLEEGFYEGQDELLFFAVCEAIRAARVLTDLSLHAHDASERAREDLARRILSATFLPEAWARAQVLRAKRLPLQGLTYAVGAAEIRALADREMPKFAKNSLFYAEFLARGPVPPSWAGRRGRGESESE